MWWIFGRIPAGLGQWRNCDCGRRVPGSCGEDGWIVAIDKRVNAMWSGCRWGRRGGGCDDEVKERWRTRIALRFSGEQTEARLVADRGLQWIVDSGRLGPGIHHACCFRLYRQQSNVHGPGECEPGHAHDVGRGRRGGGGDRRGGRLFQGVDCRHAGAGVDRHCRRRRTRVPILGTGGLAQRGGFREYERRILWRGRRWPFGCDDE